MAGGTASCTWIERLPVHPLCDVPWVGRSVVLSDGRVNFCCYSDAVVGNVNEHPLEQIWRDAPMRRIRETLARQRFPVECQSNSCPIFRGDRYSFLHERMDGRARGEEAEHDRRELDASTLAITPARVAPGDRVKVELRLASRGAPRAVDLFVGVTAPDGGVRFLPEWTETPLPFAQGVEAGGAGGPKTLALFDAPAGDEIVPGAYEICVGLFFPGANPNVAANCLWSTRGRLTIEPRAA
jgi:hypothetical protein